MFGVEPQPNYPGAEDDWPEKQPGEEVENKDVRFSEPG